MRKQYAGVVLFALGTASAQIEPNSSFFSVQNYYAPIQGGNFEAYNVSGFAQSAAPGIQPTLFLLPTIRVSQNDLKFWRRDGTQIASPASPQEVGSITVTPRVLTTMPNANQIPAIASVLDGQGINRYLPPSWKTNNTIMMRTDVVGPATQSMVEQDYKRYDDRVAEQTSLADKYRGYRTRSATLNQAEFRLLVGGEQVASRTFKGSLGGGIGAITLMDPTVFQVNQLRNGNFELLVTFRFPDAKTSYIDASFNAEKAVKNFVDETQSAITKSKASGFQVFNMGSRRSKMSTSIKNSLSAQQSLETMDNTTVVMVDATDDMIRQFENAFFPELSKEKVLENHLEAARIATAEGNPGLAKVHEDFAAAVRQENELKEVDAVGAAAALGAGDYAGFLARGVRSINSSDKKANNFRRIVNVSSESSQSKDWNQTRQVSVMREVALPVQCELPVEREVYLGICGARMGVSYPWWRRNSLGAVTPQTVQGFVITCVVDGSPIASAGLAPGSVIVAVDTKQVNSFADFENGLSGFSPGESVPLWVAEPPSVGYPETRQVMRSIVARAGSAKP
jgi:hypothetical protein